MSQVRPFHPEDEPAVLDLWRLCDLVSWEDPSRAIRRKVAFQPDLFLVAIEDDHVVGTVMGGYDGRRGWANHLGVHPERRHTGIGRDLMAELENRLRAIGCPKLNLQVRRHNQAVLGFYERAGYSVEDLVSLGKRL